MLIGIERDVNTAGEKGIEERARVALSLLFSPTIILRRCFSWLKDNGDGIKTEESI